MASIQNITALNTQAGANTALPKGLGVNSGGLLAFLNMLMGGAGDVKGAQEPDDLAAKLAAVLKKDPADKTQLTALLQKLFPDASADQLNQAVAEISGAPVSPSSGVQPALTSDLSAQFATDVQDGGDVMADLKAKFAALVQDGPITPDKLAQFRKDAIDEMKDKGFDAFSIDKTLVSLATDLGDKLSTPLAAQLGMPVPGQSVAANLNATAPAAGDEGDDVITAADFSTKQLAASASVKTDTGLPGDDAAKGLQLQQPAPDAASSSKPLNSSAAHVFVMNDAQGNSGFNASSDGQQMPQNSAGSSATSLSNMFQGAPETTTQGFINYMNAGPSAPATPTTQAVAVQIAQNANNGITTFTMQLEPAELGRLEVRMKFDRDGSLKAHLIADKPETLSLLKNDQAQIHRILNQAGLDADDNSLSFDLRQQGQQQGTDQSYNGAGQSSGFGASATASDFISAKISVEAMGYIRQDGVNIMV